MFQNMLPRPKSLVNALLQNFEALEDLGLVAVFLVGGLNFLQTGGQDRPQRDPFCTIIRFASCVSASNINSPFSVNGFGFKQSARPVIAHWQTSKSSQPTYK